MKHISRRQFVRTAAAGVALPYFIPASVLGADAPSRKITIGFIGVGDHGTGWNLDRYLKLRDARVLVVCDVDGWRMRKAKAMVDSAYDNQDCAMTKDFREVLARPDIDAVMISTPDHWHTLISVMAARAGKDVQCEKPTLTIDEGKILIETMRKHRPRLPDQHRGSFAADVSPHGRTGAQRPHRQAAEDRGDPAQAAHRPRRPDAAARAGRAGLRDVARPGALRALHQGPGALQLPLDLGLLGRDHSATGARTCSTPRSGPTTPSAAARSKSTAKAPTGKADSTTRSRTTTSPTATPMA